MEHNLLKIQNRLNLLSNSKNVSYKEAPCRPCCTIVKTNKELINIQKKIEISFKKLKTAKIAHDPIQFLMRQPSKFKDRECFSDHQVHYYEKPVEKQAPTTISIKDFDFIKYISKGAFGRVWLVKRKAT